MHTLLVATQNRGKLVEMRTLLARLPAQVVTPDEVGITLDVIEDGHSYAENAAKKALAFCRASGLVTLADDSGLEVDALDGRPGIHSARLAPWENATDADRRALLLKLLHGLPRPWTAHFHCTVAIAIPPERLEFAEGDCPGEIIPEECGSDGFGYDPIFYLPDRQATMAELGRRVKNQISHRARAVQAAIPILMHLFN
jgi:XTP/dITP diphosphohydrolase